MEKHDETIIRLNPEAAARLLEYMEANDARAASMSDEERRARAVERRERGVRALAQIRSVPAKKGVPV